MVTHKIFIGSIVFFSLAFLAACGGGSSGSAGSAGATGAAGAAGDTGATGATGSISVPDADSDLAITYQDSADVIDNDSALGSITHRLKIVGLDNITAPDSRVRYYIYEGSSATAKVVPWTNAVAAGGTGVSMTAAVIDTRDKTADNISISYSSDTLDRVDGSITHMIICPGNEAGDATTCASYALSDRGAQGAGTAGVANDNGTSTAVMVVNDTTSTNDFVAIQADTTGLSASDVAVSTTKSTEPTFTRDTTGISTESNVHGQLRHKLSSASSYYVAGMVRGDADNVTYAPISSGAIGTAVNAGATSAGGHGGTIGFLALEDGGTTTFLAACSTDNCSVYTVGASSLTVWNDNLTSALTADPSIMFGDNLTTGSAGMAFAASPNGDRAVIIGFYDNNTSEPWMAALSPTAMDRDNTMDNGTYDIALNTDNDTAYMLNGSNPFTMTAINPDAAAAWCNDGSDGDALWVATSANDNSDFVLSKWTDNGTAGAAWYGLFDLADVSTESADNSSSDNITSLDMACDPDDYMPVLAVGYDSAAGDYALAKFDNNTNAWEELFTSADGAMTAQEHVTVEVSSDGSVYAVGFNGSTGDNASVQIFYDE